MLPKKQRMNTRLFKEIFKRGKNYHSGFLGAKIFILKKGEKERFAFVVSKKIDKKASTRNLLKRRGYAIIKEFLPKIKTPVMVIFILKKGSEKLSFEEYKEEIEFILKKANLL